MATAWMDESRKEGRPGSWLWLLIVLGFDLPSVTVTSVGVGGITVSSVMVVSTNETPQQKQGGRTRKKSTIFNLRTVLPVRLRLEREWQNRTNSNRHGTLDSNSWSFIVAEIVPLWLAHCRWEWHSWEIEFQKIPFQVWYLGARHQVDIF